MMIYLIIFLSKVFENALATLRLIVVASGRKIFGAILQLCITLIWISITGIVIVNLNKDPLKIIFFSIGSLVGSYLGSLLEEKIATGYNIIAYQTSSNVLKNVLNSKKINYTIIKTVNQKNIFLITTSRRHKNHILNLIKEYDCNATILSEIINLHKPGN